MIHVYNKFVEDKLVKTPNKDYILKLEDAYCVFRTWYKSDYDSVNLPLRKDFKTALDKIFNQKYGTGSNAGWVGWMCKNESKDYDKHQKMSDVYTEFIEDKLVKTSNKDRILKLETAYRVFRTWYESGYDSVNLPLRKDFKNALDKKFNQKYGTGSNAGWVGWMCKDESKRPNKENL